MSRSLWSIFVVLVPVLISASAAFADEEFPLRNEYPGTIPIKIGDLAKQYDKDFIVDVRSKFEFEVVHIAKAVHIPMNNKGLFLSGLAALRPKSGDVPIVLYCNGVKCKKSYEAAGYASEAGFNAVFVFDAGVITWLKANPDRSFLLGKTPADPKKIISAEKFKSVLVSFDDIKKASESKSAVLFDVRDAAQQTKKIDLPNVKKLELANVLSLLQKGLFKDKELYFMDSVGKQVEWLQYHLEDLNYTNYHFLNGGIDSLK